MILPFQFTNQPSRQVVMNNNHLVPNKYQSQAGATNATDISKQDIITGINELLEVQANTVNGGG